MVFPQCCLYGIAVRCAHNSHIHLPLCRLPIVCGVFSISRWHSHIENILRGSVVRSTHWTRRLNSPSNSQRTRTALVLPQPHPWMKTKRWTSLSPRMGSSSSMETTTAVRGSWIQMTIPPVNSSTVQFRCIHSSRSFGSY